MAKNAGGKGRAHRKVEQWAVTSTANKVQLQPKYSDVYPWECLRGSAHPFAVGRRVTKLLSATTDPPCSNPNTNSRNSPHSPRHVRNPGSTLRTAAAPDPGVLRTAEEIIRNHGHNCGRTGKHTHANPKAEKKKKKQKNPEAAPGLWAMMLRAAGNRLLAPGLRRLAGGAGPAASVTGARAYHERVVDHYNNPRNVGSFDKDDPNVGTGLVGAPACGDVMKLQIRVDEGSGKIVDACFKTFGCGSAIASSSVATEWVKGKQMEEVLTIKNTEIAKHLSLPPVKLHCSMLAEDAIKAAVKDYEAKKGKTVQKGEDSPSEKVAEA